MIFGIISLLVSLALPVVLVVVIVRAVSARQGRVGEGHGVRRFFQYLLLLGLLVVTLIGVAELITLAVTPVLADTGGALARGLTFTLFGGGLLTGVVLWTRATMRGDPGERGSTAWAVYLTLAGLVTAIVAAVGLGTLAHGLVRGRPDAGSAVVVVVWGLAWALHWRLVARTLDRSREVALMLVGSLIGWSIGVAGLVTLLSVTLRLVVPQPTALVGPSAVTQGLAAGVGLLAAGAWLWLPHWTRRMSTAPRDPVWLGYVLVVGLGASLVVTLTGASIVAYRVLVWLLGDPGTIGAAAYLAATTVPLAMAVVGALSWWYHRAVLLAGAAPERTEAARVHEYLLAGIALGAAATGVALVVVALVDAVAPAPRELVTTSVVNALLAAVTLLMVGGPLWWWFWRRIAVARAADPVGEAASPTRRVYLVVLFGVAGVVAVIVVLVGAFVVLDDAIRGTVSAETLRDARVPLGILLAAGAVSGYHWLIQRADRGVATPATVRGPSVVLLVGPRDDALAREIRRVTGARVDTWPADGPAWDGPGVLAAVAGVHMPRVLVLSDAQGLRVVGSGREVGRSDDSAPDADEHGDEPGGGG